MSKSKVLLFAVLISSALFSACANSSAQSENSVTPNNNLQTPSPTPTVENQNENRLTFDEFAAQQKLPRSEDFPVKKSEMFSGTPAKPILSEKRARLYRTVLSEGAERGANFAGHYTVVTWGAGMGNFSLAFIDTKSGKIYFPPFESISSTNYGLPGLDDGNNPAFRLDSKLFVFIGCPGKEYEGCPDWEKDGFYLYSFNYGRFKLERFIKRKELEAVLKK
jgi:opacity protein-like surface antigen